MKKYGVWNFVILMDDGEVVRCNVTATSGKDARRRVEARYEGWEVLKMTRIEWLAGFSYAQLSAAIMGACPTRGQALLDILTDNGVFFRQVADETLD